MTRSVRPTRATTRTLLIIGAACSGTGLLIAACSSSAATHTAAAGAPAAQRRPAAAPGAVYGPASAPSYGKLALNPQARLTTLVLPTQSLIYTANLTVRATDVTAAATAMTSLVTAVGGYVSGEQETVQPGSHGTAQVNLEFKIPVAQYKPTLQALATKYGTQLQLSQQAQDVTQQVADVSSRVTSAQDAITQLRALLARAGNVGSLLAVQNEINNQETALESLLAQQQALTHETSYGTVSVLIVGRHVAIVKKPKKRSHGFVAGLGAGWRAFVGAVTWLLTALGAVLPFVVLVAVLAGIAVLGRRRLARRRTSTAADPPATAASS